MAIARWPHRPVLVAVLAVLVSACAGQGSSPGSTPVGLPTLGRTATEVPSTAGSATPGLPSSPSSPASTSNPTGTLATPTSTPPSTPEATMIDFVLTSADFDAGGLIPKRFTCDGEDISPELSWSGAPAGTEALVLVVDDPDARGWIHWLALDLPGAPGGELQRDVRPSAGTPNQGRNDFGRVGWGGPCPPSGTHRYTFTLYALAAPLALSGTPDGSAVRKALSAAEVLDKAVLEARYRRGG